MIKGMGKTMLAILGFVFLQFSCNQQDAPTHYISATVEDGIQFTSPQETGMDSIQLNKMTDAISDGEYPNIHSVLVAKDGKLVYEKYFPGKDEILGESIGVVNHHVDTLHDVRSVTKSIVSACVGIALSEGKIKRIEQPVWDYFPEYIKLKKDDNANLTIKHLLTMTSGLEWNENIPYTDPANSEIQMDRSPDPIGFVLSRKVVQPPGIAWNYNGGTTQVLAAIIKKVTGEEVDEYARKHLFTPLGISHFAWLKFPDSSTLRGVPLAAAGLRLRSRDMLKIGLLYMNQGTWNDKQILPKEWVEDSHKSHVRRQDPISGKGGYGYQFWIFNEQTGDKPIELAAAVGNGDQRIFFDRQHHLVVVTTAGNYNQWTIKNNVAALLRNFVYPSLGVSAKK
jgi:CubicO group peptidase (beta-lactamase class C family)